MDAPVPLRDFNHEPAVKKAWIRTGVGRGRGHDESAQRALVGNSRTIELYAFCSLTTRAAPIAASCSEAVPPE